MKTIGDRIREERKKLGLSVGDFAARIHVHRNTQSRYESGERIPDTGYLLALFDVGIDLRALFHGASFPIEVIPAIERIWELEGQQFVVRAILSDLDLIGLQDDVAGLPEAAGRRPRLERLIARSPGLTELFEYAAKIDVDLLAKVIESVERAIVRAGVEIRSDRKSRLVAITYKASAASGKIDDALIDATLALTL